MRSSKQIAELIDDAVMKHDDTYRTMLRAAAKCKRLDQTIRRLQKQKRKAKAAERDAYQRFPMATPDKTTESN